MLFQVFGQRLAAVEDFLELGVGNITSDHDGAVEQERVSALELGQLGQNAFHRLVQIDLVPMLMLGHAVLLWQQTTRITIHFLDKQPVAGDLGFDVTVCGA